MNVEAVARGNGMEGSEASSTDDPAVVNPAQLPVIHRIVADETWLESERRGQKVPPHDPTVRANVCAVVLRIGARLRASVTASRVSLD